MKYLLLSLALIACTPAPRCLDDHDANYGQIVSGKGFLKYQDAIVIGESDRHFLKKDQYGRVICWSKAYIARTMEGDEFITIIKYEK